METWSIRHAVGPRRDCPGRGDRPERARRLQPWRRRIGVAAASIAPAREPASRSAATGRRAADDGDRPARPGARRAPANVTVAYRTWGRLNAAGDNAVLVLHALTGDSLAGGAGGWWEPLIGPGRALDTDHAFVVCANILGGCQGTTGPASDRPAHRPALRACASR